jgi:hypothetical protein
MRLLLLVSVSTITNALLPSNIVSDEELVSISTITNALLPSDIVSDEEQGCLDRECDGSSRANSLLQRNFHVGEDLQQRAVQEELFLKDLSLLLENSMHNLTKQLHAATPAGPAALDLTEQDPTEAGAGSETVKSKPSKVLFAALGVFLVFNVYLVYYCSHREKFADKKDHDLFNMNERGKLYAYNNERLLTWRILFTNTPAIVLSWRVWIVVPCVLLLAFGSALMIAIEFPHAEKLESMRIEKFSTYLRVFIAFMLGLYMNNSFGRWQSSVTTFRQLLTSIKQLMFNIRVMNVRSELAEAVQRKCLVACYILEAEVRTDLSCKASACKEHWDGVWTSLEENKLLTKDEGHAIRKQSKAQLDMDMGGHSTMIWAWIARAVSQIKEEPGVPIPMYVRCVAIMHACVGQVDQLKQCVNVQVPFTYAYLLSTIVHLHNVFLALCTGVQIGSSLSGLTAEDDSAKAASLLAMTSYESAATVGMQTVILLIQPLMYQACLVIAHLLNHPFGDELFHLPTEMFILLLQDELRVSADSFGDQSAPDVVKIASGNDDEEEEPDDDDEGDDDGGDDDGGD